MRYYIKLNLQLINNKKKEKKLLSGALESARDLKVG
jgi:hypothetical protein